MDEEVKPKRNRRTKKQMEAYRKEQAMLPPKRRGNPNWLKPLPANHVHKPRAVSNKIHESFMSALHDDFILHGAQAIETVREKSPDKYLKLFTVFVERTMTVKRDMLDDLRELTPEQIRGEMILAVQRLMESGDNDGNGGLESLRRRFSENSVSDPGKVVN